MPGRPSSSRPCSIQRASVAGYWQQAKNRQASWEDRNTAADRSRINTFDNRVWGFAGDVTLFAALRDAYWNRKPKM